MILPSPAQQLSINYLNNFRVESLPLKILEHYVKSSEGHDKSNTETVSIVNLTTRLYANSTVGSMYSFICSAFTVEYYISSTVALHFFKHICI